MPVYLSDQPDITADVLDLRRRLSILENNQSSGGTTTSTTTVITGGGSVPPGGWTYSQLGSDVTTTFDSRYVNVTGDSMSGSLTIGGTLGVTGATTVGGSLDVATNTTISGNITVHGGLLTFDAQNATFEIGSVGISNAPKLDFHSGLAGTDYDVRLVASGGTGTAGNGALSILAGTIAIPTISNAVTMNSSLHTVGSITDDGVLYVTGGATLGAGVAVVSTSGGGGGADPYPGSADFPASSYYPSVGGLGGGSGDMTITGTFSVTSTSNLAGDVTFGAGIVGSPFGQSDNSLFAWDGGSKRIGFSKKAGVQGKLAYASQPFVVTQYVGQTTIAATNTQTDRLTIDLSGVMTVPGAVSFGSTLGVTGVATFTAAAVFNGGISTKDFITGGGGAGIGNIAGATVDTYNIKDSAVTAAKLSPGALSTAAAPSGTANNQRGRFLRYVTASPSTQDAAGQNLDNLRIPATTGVARTSDSQAYGSQAIRVTASTWAGGSGSAFMFGPYYGSNANDYTGSPGLPPGQYRATVYVKLSSAASTLPVIAFDVHDGTAGTISNDGVLYTYKGTELSTLYVGASFPIYVLADTAGTAGLEIRAYYLGGSGGPNVNISHVTVEPWSGLSQQEVDGTYIKNATINDAHINTLSAGKITTGTLTADVTQSGVIRTGPDTGARVLLNSGGLYAYSDATTNTVQILNTGAVSITGTINATGGTFTGVVSGGTFRGGTFETGTGTVSVVRFDSTGIKGWNSSGVNTFSLLTSGALTATNATITGAINATSGTFTGTIYGTTLAGAVIRSTASIDSRNPEGINGTTDWHDISDGPTATITQQTGTGSGVGAGNAIRFAYIATTPQVSAPTQNAATANPTGGSFATGTYFWVVTATNAIGETTKSNEQSATIVLNGTATISWNAASGATGYKIYRGTATNAENRLVGTVGATTTFTDTGGAGSAATPPGSNTTSNARTFNVPAHFPFASAGLISVGQAITWSFYARLISGDGVINPYIAHGDSTNVLLAQQGNITLTGSWVRYTRSGTALMTSDMAHETLFPRPNMQTAGTIEITGSQIEVGPSATPYGNGQQRMDFDQSGLHAYDSTGTSVTTISTSDGKLTANNITANSGTFSGTISAAGMTLTGGTFSSTSIQASTIDATNNINAGSLTSGTLSTARISVASGFSENLVLNGGFEDAVALANWSQQYETAGTAISYSVGTSNVFAGANRAEVALATNQGTAQASSSIPVSGGETYSVRGRMRAEGASPTNGRFYVRVLFGTAKDFARGSIVGTTPSHTTIAPAGHTGADAAGYSDIVSAYAPAANTWIAFEGSVVVPTGATWMRVATYAWQNASGSWTGAFDEIVVRRQVTGTVIADGSITTNSMSANSISGDRIQANTLSASKISTGTLNASTLITVGTAGGARVEIDGNASTGGIKLFNSSNATTVNLKASDGTATFTGVLNAAGGTFSGSISSSATITGGVFKTAASGSRVEIGSTVDAIKFYQGSATNGASVTVFVDPDDSTSTAIQVKDGTSSAYMQMSKKFIGYHTDTGGSMSGLFESYANFTTGEFRVGTVGGVTNFRYGSSGQSGNWVSYASSYTFNGGSLNGVGGVYDNSNRVWSPSNPAIHSTSYLWANGVVESDVQLYAPGSATCYVGSWIEAGGYIRSDDHFYTIGYMQTPTIYDANGYAFMTSGATGGRFLVETSSGGGYTHIACASGGFTVQARDLNDSVWVTIQALSFSTMSAAELKTDVETHDFGLAAVRQLRPVSFKWAHDDGGTYEDNLGLIAEEVEEVIPHAVSRQNKEDLPGLDYTAVTSVLIKAIQELDAKIEALEKGSK